jgi:hypothetical protein
MSYRHSPVFPADFRVSKPERDIDYPGRLGRPQAPVHDQSRNYSRSTMAYTICTLAASAAFIAAGLPFLALGEEMAWWLFATYPVGGGFAALLVLIWRGGKDDESRRKTAWQAIFGLVAAVGVPRFAYFLHPALGQSEFLRDPITLGVIGFLFFLAGSGIAPGIMKWWDKDAPGIGYNEAKKASKRYIETPTEKLKK